MRRDSVNGGSTIVPVTVTSEVVRSIWRSAAARAVYVPCSPKPPEGAPTLERPHVVMSPPPHASNHALSTSSSGWGGPCSPAGLIQAGGGPPNQAAPMSSPRSGSSRRSIPCQTLMSTAREPAAGPSSTSDDTALASWSGCGSLEAGIMPGACGRGADGAVAREAAVHEGLVARHVTGGIRGEEDGRISDLRRMRDVAERDALFVGCADLGGVRRRVERGVCRSRRERVDGDAVRCELEGERAGQADDSALGGDVRGEIGERLDVGGGADVDDPAPCGLHHSPRGDPAAPDVAEQVDVEQAAPVLLRGVEEGLHEWARGVVDPDVEPPEGLNGCVCCSLVVGGYPGVPGQVLGAPSPLRNRRCGLGAVVERDAHDVRPCGCERDCDRLPDAARRTGDDRAAACEVERRCRVHGADTSRSLRSRALSSFARRRERSSRPAPSTRRAAAMAPTRLLERKPGASTSSVRSPACAALPGPSTIPSVMRFGEAIRTATANRTIRPFQLWIRRSPRNSTTRATSVNVKP